MKNIFCLPLLLFTIPLAAQNRDAAIIESSQVFTTYPYSDPDPVPNSGIIYPYFRYDGFTTRGEQKEWKVVLMENDYIKLMVLPEIGGKIWMAIEKSTNQPFIYYNHVIKFRDVAMRGPWTSGGIEANYGIIGHTPNCATSVDYVTRKNADGSVSCIIGVLDLLTRTRWTIEINLPKDKAYFTTKSLWYNETPVETPYYHWMNAGVKANGGLAFMFPGTSYLGHNGEHAAWPINEENGKNISFYDQNDFGGYKSYHVFGKYTNFFGAYWHKDNYGMVRYSAQSDKAGKKVWIWGLSRQGMLWEKLLTDSDGQYVEIQSGRLFNQSAPKSAFTPFKHRSFGPYASDEWTEYWYPVLKTKGFVEANEYGAFNMINEHGMIKLYFSPVQQIRDTITIINNNKIIYKKSITLNPLELFTDSIPLLADTPNLTVRIGEHKLIYTSAADANKLNRPLDSPADFDWNSSYGLYMQGKELADQKMYAEAEPKLAAALEKDHNFLPALVKMAELHYRSMRYASALEFSKKALSIDTYDGAANYYYGLINIQTGQIADAKDAFGIAALSTDYRSAAYTQLGELYTKENDRDKAILYALKAIDFNRYNIAAYKLLAISYRQLNDRSSARAILDNILSFDPLNHFVAFEEYLWHHSDTTARQLYAGIRNELPQETWEEGAIDYFNKGLITDCEEVLKMAPTGAITGYWLAYLQYVQGQPFSAALDNANAISPAMVFPFRPETARVLTWAATQSNHWKPKYYLALIYRHLDRMQECRDLFTEPANAPDYAPFYAARAELFRETDPDKYLADIFRGLQLDKNEWRYYKMLTNYYLDHQQNSKALDLAASFYKSHPAHYIMGMLYAKTLLLNDRYSEADKVLSKLEIIPFEGASEGRSLYREAKLLLALQRMQQKDYSKALQYISQAKEWPEHLGAGKPYETDVDERLEQWMAGRCYHHLRDSSKEQNCLLAILKFKPAASGHDGNTIISNNLVTAWALEKTSTRDKANQWLSEQAAMYPGNKIMLWCKNSFENSGPQQPAPNEKDASLSILEKVMKL